MYTSHVNTAICPASDPCPCEIRGPANSARPFAASSAVSIECCCFARVSSGPAVPTYYAISPVPRVCFGRLLSQSYTKAEPWAAKANITVDAMPVLEGVPTIDAAEFFGPGNEGKRPSQSVIDKVREAATAWGFFQLINHGVSQDLLDEHYEAMKQFFKLPQGVKDGCRRSKDNSMGYFNDEYTKQKLDLKEGFDFRHTPKPELPDDHPDNHDQQGVNRWPEGQPDFKNINERYFQEVTRVAFRLLEVFAIGLDLEPTALHHLFQPTHTSFLRLNYYPVTPSAAPQELGISPHKDAGFLTVLVQDNVAGLQVLRDGVWHLVPPVKGAFTINVGDMAQVTTNDLFIASNHRVLQSKTSDRYSRAFFFNPSHTADIKPLVTATGQVSHYKPINWWEFRRKRFEGDYANVGEEVQIDWYRLDHEDGPVDKV